MAIAQGCYKLYQTNTESNIPQSSSYMATYHPSQKPSKLEEQDMQDTPREVRMNSLATFSHGPLHTDVQVLND